MRALLLATLLLPVSLAAQQSPAPTPAAAPAAKPRVARVIVTPVRRVVNAGETLQLSAEARDEAGNVVDGVTFRFSQTGAYFEGSLSPAGLVTAGATGVMPAAVVAIRQGEQPVVERFEVRMVPGPAARIALSPMPERLVPGQRIRLNAEVLSAIGDRREDRVQWSSSNPRVLTVNEVGLVTAVAAGRARITAKVGDVERAHEIQVLAAQVASLSVEPGVTDGRTGDVLRFRAVARDAQGREIAGVTPVWSFSPGQGMLDADGSFVGYEPGSYTVTASLGNRTADAVVTLTARGVRRPLTVVGRLPRTRFNTEEVWLHPNGQVAYLGSGGGGDVLYAIDISNPAAPVVTDSIVANTRRVNDVMTTPDGKYLVFTREGAADRRNGVVFASLEDPRHPKVISEFTQGVTAGVHSSFIYKDPRHGQHVFLTNDGTGALHILNIDDPANPREVAQWKTENRPDAGRTLHDIDVQDGLLYGSWWNDGLVILDVGNGIKGGSPSNPVMVSQYKYDLNALYRDVEASGGPGFIRGTHTAWRHRNYVFIADEVFPSSGVRGAKDAAAGRAYGRLQVIDVSDLEKPRSVAWYEPEFGGVHNVWVAGDSLYMGAYNAGFRVFDVSGELKGDLRAQGREIGHLNTADMDGRARNTAMTWGVVVRDGLAYVNDMNNGLWIVRIEPKTGVVP
ncbi:Ig-like domain-containing protein [Pseudogemmatithrix spongiicola]|uniref:Ig-like domain-containing protein n=1 Tax=Pseudogemmatithrix spongiicola TaxID=3062599 RepID=A0AA49Q492_9BACT|nr:Ig-like domain-containing protein [Gemmatimonadaceae bacterium 'strain 138']WKW14518.1 Ig-like domain-containing protein [Gemmatimonadaceae bacterium 'strain 318']